MCQSGGLTFSIGRGSKPEMVGEIRKLSSWTLEWCVYWLGSVPAH